MFQVRREGPALVRGVLRHMEGELVIPAWAWRRVRHEHLPWGPAEQGRWFCALCNLAGPPGIPSWLWSPYLPHRTQRRLRRAGSS